MTVEQQITAAISTGKTVAMDWTQKFLDRVFYGEDLGLSELRLVCLVEWINILEDYKIENFGDAGAIEPDVECLSLDQALLLVSKINSLEC